MKYLDLSTLHELNVALNFETPDTAIIGGADVWITKAAGGDKKLYKRIENTLETRHNDLLTAFAALSDESKERFRDSLNLERITPFGTFHDPANRHKFAYFIATLNATHVDYDFANTCNTDEFEKVDMATFIREIDMRMYYLRPQFYSAGLPEGAMTPLGSPIWSPRSWKALDGELNLAQCECYVWKPEDDPHVEDGAIWTHHYFLYNKQHKRVCYFYLRGVSALSSSPPVAMSLMSRFKQAQYESNPNEASKKRAEYWLGSRAKRGLEYYGESDELDNMVIEHPEDVVDADEVGDYRETSVGLDFSSDDESDVEFLRERERSAIREREKDAQRERQWREKSRELSALREREASAVHPVVNRMEL
ncbi:repressor of RNA polymerase III transcription MAF1 [Polyplosphaeria fusca]|uniref:Repressor of RNA polymerase III transcription MAF1 n=1 Tax=Polyplosphaeria fusca TaxID=682080 RepID=A0A9P4RB52_9PLEO|nr:repressor of RNA polymerase III transcription MAF1 [Polyplosphaeria fusca]